MNRFDWVSSLWQDFRYAARGLRQNPAFAAVAIATFALAIGANTAIFSVIDAAILRPLPYPDSAQLVFLWNGDPDQSILYSFSYPRFETFRDRSDEFSGVAAYDDEPVSFADRGEPERIEGGRVSREFFPVLGVKPALGREFSAGEDRPGGARVAMLSYHWWEQRYASDPHVLGRTVRIDGEDHIVIGVLPKGFQFLGQPVEVWRCRLFDTRTFAPASVRMGASYLTVIARLRPGVTLAQARTKVALVDAEYKRANPDHSDLDGSVNAGLLQERIFSWVRVRVFVLWGAVGCLLMIACANVANLLLSRATARRQEISLRLAVGASRGRIARQLLTESILIAACGGILGLPLAAWGVGFLIDAIHQSTPQLPDASVDARVLAFTAAVSLLVGIAFGLAPVFFSLRGELHDGLRSGSRGSSGSLSRGRFRGVLVACEFALCLVLLTAAGLLAQSFLGMQKMRTGVETDRVWVMNLALLPDRYDRWEARTAFYDEVARRVNAVPGVTAAGISTRVNLVQYGLGYMVWIEGATYENGRNAGARGRSITPDYLQAMGIPIVRGRGFTTRDTASSPKVMLVNERFARRFFPGQDPIGRRVTYSSDHITCEIVGVVRDVRSSPQEAEPDDEIYLPLPQRPWLVARLVARLAGNPAGIVAAIRREVQAVDHDQAVVEIEPFEELMGRRMQQPRMTMLLVLVFAATALLLAAVGIYGVMAYGVAQRSREIGIRMALGARPQDVRTLVIRQSLQLVLFGVAVGIPAAAALGRLYASLLFGVTPADPATMAGVAALLSLVALAASYVPAARATRVDPVVVLRSE
ncbi:MAG TPA: ABC transporter permease [Bryobacteraceae bacterium]|nr:ABC transporter permease [Bryobacteraceae bacterium]